MYALLVGDDSAGLSTFTVAQQFDANGNPQPFTGNTNYFMPTAVSCNGCNNIQESTCMGPFTAT